jgi:hypothetical protein
MLPLVFAAEGRTFDSLGDQFEERALSDSSAGIWPAKVSRSARLKARCGPFIKSKTSSRRNERI